MEKHIYEPLMGWIAQQTYAKVFDWPIKTHNPLMGWIPNKLELRLRHIQETKYAEIATRQTY